MTASLTKRQGGNFAASWARNRQLSLDYYKEAGPLVLAMSRGGSTHGEIAAVLNAAGYRVRRTQAPFSKAMVRTLLLMFSRD